MLERILSPRGFKIYFGCVIVMLAYVVWLWFTNSGAVAWINQMQAQYIFSGYYYPEMTVALLLIPILAISFGAGFLHDYITQQGIFTDRQNAHDLSKPAASFKLEYQETTRKDMIDEVRTKYRSEIYQLKLLGFEEFGFYQEVLPWFGIPMGAFGIFGAIGILSNEITRIGSNLTVNAFYVLMASKKDSTSASVAKIGVQFRTEFADGTYLASSAYKGMEIQDDIHKIYVIPAYRSIQTAWADHQKQVEKFVAEGKTIKENLNMADYLSAVKRLEEYVRKNLSKVSKASSKAEPSFISTIGSTLVSTLISVGIFAACILGFIFLGNLISHIYPSCWFVRNLHSVFLPLQFLGIPFSLATSWGLARLQHKQHSLFTVNGIGTRLYGSEPDSSGKGFISTKWLVLPGVPLVPVKSYALSIKDVDPWGKATYNMQPLDEIHWEQVRETYRGSWLGYGILAALYVAFTVWAISECG